MKTNDLLTIWGAPEPPRLTPKQVSIRLPILVSAKIAALLELYPKKTKTDIIGDLLITALEMLEKELPMNIDKNDPDSFQDYDKNYYGYNGIRKNYFQVTEKYLRKMEKEAKIKEPMNFSYPNVYTEADFKWDKKE